MKRADKQIERQYLKNSKNYIAYRDELKEEILQQKSAILTKLIDEGLELPIEYSYLLECLSDELEYLEDEHKSRAN